MCRLNVPLEERANEDVICQEEAVDDIFIETELAIETMTCVKTLVYPVEREVIIRDDIIQADTFSGKANEIIRNELNVDYR